MRGNLSGEAYGTGWARSIPAPCGGTKAGKGRIITDIGLSPRVRGNRSSPARGNVVIRSIPARAGEPNFTYTQLCNKTVYPRACGGTMG